MLKTWITFSVNNQRVHQMEYNGCMGQNVVDATKTMVAGQHKVNERDVKIGFDDLVKIVKKQVDLKIVSALIKNINTSIFWN